MDAFDAKTLWTILHLFGVVLGAGGAYLGDTLFFFSTRNGVLSAVELSFLKRMGSFVWVGLALLLVSGIGLFLLDPERYLASSKFLSKMVIVAVIAANGVIFHTVHFKVLKSLIGVPFRSSKEFRRKGLFMLMSGAVSVVSWTSALVLGSLRSLPFTVGEILGVYAVMVLCAVSAALVFRRFFLHHE